MTSVPPRRLRPSRRPPERDTDATPFAEILVRLVKCLPGAFAAALVDAEGETVDYVGLSDAFELRVAAAEARLALDQVSRAMRASEAHWMVIRGERRSITARKLPDGYALVVLFRRRAGFTASRRAFAACERELAAEAGWPIAKNDRSWWAVQVEMDVRGRPSRVRVPGRDDVVAVEVLGAVMGLSAREKGFRVRTQHGEEVTLVREARRCWYADVAMR